MVRASDAPINRFATAQEDGGGDAPSLLKLVRESGDANLGQTLIRLAALAAAEHGAQVDAAGQGDRDATEPGAREAR